MKKSNIIINFGVLILLILIYIFPCHILSADEINLAEKLAGKILLQVESHGEAWYVNTNDLKRYYLGRPEDAFKIIKDLGVGITNNDLAKIRIGITAQVSGKDSDSDGLADNFEDAIGADKNKKDTDNDGYDDKTEILNDYNPTSQNNYKIDKLFSQKNKGKIYIQTQNNGEAWYVNPYDLKRYYLGRPSDMFLIMKILGIGITNNDLNKISIYKTNISDPITIIDNKDRIIYLAADAIRNKNKTLAASYFIPEMKKAIDYNLDNMSDESILALGNILSGSTLQSSTDTEKNYSNDVYFALGDQKIHLEFIVKKQPDGKWLLSNL